VGWALRAFDAIDFDAIDFDAIDMAAC